MYATAKLFFGVPLKARLSWLEVRELNEQYTEGTSWVFEHLEYNPNYPETARTVLRVRLNFGRPISDGFAPIRSFEDYGHGSRASLEAAYFKFLSDLPKDLRDKLGIDLTKKPDLYMGIDMVN